MNGSTVVGQASSPGFKVIDNRLYYFNGTDDYNYGSLYTTSGWNNNIGGVSGRYYVYSDGEIATGEHIIDGVRYLFNSNGVLQGEIEWSGLEEVIIEAGTEFNPLEGVTAPDGNTLTESNVTYTGGFNPRAPKVGTYIATYTASVNGHTVTATRNIVVVKRNSNFPTINGIDEKTIAKGVDFDPLEGVTAIDKEDASENIKLTVEAPADFNVNKEGTYVFTYRAEDLDGNVTESPRVIKVKEMVDSNFVRGLWVGSSLVFEGNFDILGTNADDNASKKLVIKDSSGNVVSETDADNLTGNATGYRELIDDSIFSKLTSGNTYNLFVKSTVNGKTYEEPVVQLATTRNAYVTNGNDLAEKEFNDYKIKFKSDSGSNQVQIVKSSLADTEKPVITAPAISVVRGTANFDLKQGVTISDNVDSQADLLGNLVIDKCNFDINQVGTYQVTYKVTDSAGNESDTVTRTITVTPKTTAKPTISGANAVSIVQGTSFNSKSGVTATSAENEDLTSKITVSGTVNTNTHGTYKLTYTVKDIDNNTTTVERVVTVTAKPAANTLPIINVNSVHEIFVGDSFDPLAIATATDKEDGDITSSLKVVTNKVNVNKAGEYQVKYTVTDSEGNTKIAYRTVKVEGQNIVTPPAVTSQKPVISFPETTVIKTGTTFDPLAGVTATDYKGNNIALTTSNVSWNKVNTSKPGEYQVKYTVKDSEGNSKIAYRTVKVEQATVTSKKPVISFPENTVIKTGTTFNPLDGVTVTDYKGQEIKLTTSNVATNKGDTSKAGTYEVKYTVTDLEGNNKIARRTITVEGVTAINYKGQEIKLTTSNVAANKVNTNKPGSYQVKYTVTDLEGNNKIAYRDIVVKGFTSLKGDASINSLIMDINKNQIVIRGEVNTLIRILNGTEVMYQL
ncbi:DUF5011 domain-containing protein [Clostridium sp. DSM 100503]|uniref:immunoglobulin-like domain-containing protein n=1 Tax=Clostridium sp. DSM 100503 TaxID=2963282 RepID=UPI00214A7B85|nr:immunoglobulin-like domain-containing protein [Clostridium sp. DSM 100503]MCR1952217.1 DUF5011 domain-containing protein [Clostridium sp. DSM 100503]